MRRTWPEPGWRGCAIGAIALLSAVALTLAPTLAAAQDRRTTTAADPADEISYPASFYAAFGVQTALDIVMRTPGFRFDTGDEVRGFGGAAGNVLIGGQRPTVKSGGIAEILRRIPAARVARVVLIRGGGMAAEAQGQALIANIVLVGDRGSGNAAPAASDADADDADDGGTATVTLARQRNGWIAPTGEVSYGTKFGHWSASGTASLAIDREDVRGLYAIRDADRRLTQSWIEAAPSRSIESALSGSLSGPLHGGTLTLNARRSQDWYRDRVQLDVRAGPPSGPRLARRALDYDETFREVEIGADWNGRAWADWTAKLVLLARPNRDRTEQDGTNESGETRSIQRQRAFEGIARATLSRGSAGGLRPELGVEVAYNRLRSALDFFEDGVAVPLPGSALTVSELRGEAFANLAQPITRTLRGEAGLAAERSRIRVVGDIGNARLLTYLKPSAALIRDLGRRTQARLSVRRTVDQLDFDDFAASVQSVEDRPISGNARLRPARITRAALRLDHRWGQTGAVAAEAFYERRDGVLDYVPTLGGGQAIGIAGDGRVLGLSIQATLPLDAVLAGARLTADATLRDTRLHDDALGRTRPLSELPTREATLGFRHDWARLRSSWGIDLVTPRTLRTFYVDEIERLRIAARLAVYAETSQVKGVRITLRARAITGEDVYRLRQFYDLPSDGAFAGSQGRRRDRGARIVLGVVRSL